MKKGMIYLKRNAIQDLIKWKSIFEANKNPHRIIELLSMIAGEKILPEKMLVIFDEIQECPEALNTLKYFKEKANEYHVIAAGSLLDLMSFLKQLIRQRSLRFSVSLSKSTRTTSPSTTER